MVDVVVAVEEEEVEEEGGVCGTTPAPREAAPPGAREATVAGARVTPPRNPATRWGILWDAWGTSVGLVVVLWPAMTVNRWKGCMP